MKKGILTRIYASLCVLLLIAGIIAVFAFAWGAGIAETVQCLIGMFLAFLFAPLFHEIGHVIFAAKANMQLVYTKFFCFKLYRKNGKLRFALASPFASDQTQVVPKNGGDMLRRARGYTIGGLVLGGILFALLLTGSIVLLCLHVRAYLLLATLPYTGYLFFLNVLPLEYPTGKTDMLIYRGLRRGDDVEKTMLSAMEIQGRLYAGESYAEIDETLYLSTPQLREDEPLFSVMQELRYRYYLEKIEMEKAADALNRLAMTQAYLSPSEAERVAAELVYMHSLLGNYKEAEDSGKLCQDFLKSETVQAKRILAAFCKANGKIEEAEILIQQAKSLLYTEFIQGVGKSEEILLSRILA